MKKVFFKSLFTLVMLYGVNLYAQNVAINASGNNPDGSAMLDIQSTTGGLLIPRMSTLQREDINNPAKGLMVFDNDLNQFWFFNGTAWTAIGGGDNIYSADGTLNADREVTHDGNDLTFTTGTGRVIVDGNLQTGAIYGNFRTQALPLIAADWSANDFTIRFTGTIGSLELPNPATNAGRIISLRNAESTGKAFSANAPLGNSTIGPYRGIIVQSDGTNWHIIGGF